MKRIYLITCFVFAATCLFTSCSSLKNLPTNTSGDVFSLNGNWILTSSTDATAEVGTVVTVLPVVSTAIVKTLVNNTYCYKAKDIVWKDIKSVAAGGFTINQLAGACNGTIVYKEGQITIVNNNQVKVNSKTAAGADLVQEWKRGTN